MSGLMYVLMLVILLLGLHLMQLLLELGLRPRKDLVLMLLGHHDHTVAVAQHDVARMHGDAAANNGHVFIPSDKLTEASAALLDLPRETVAAGIERLAEQERIVRDTLADMELCYLPEFYEAERYVSRRLFEMARQPEKPPRAVPFR